MHRQPLANALIKALRSNADRADMLQCYQHFTQRLPAASGPQQRQQPGFSFLSDLKRTNVLLEQSSPMSANRPRESLAYSFQ